MTGSMLLDANVLVYATDPAAAEKQRRSVETMDRVVQRGVGCLSTQVLSEFFRVATEKLSKPLSPAEAHRQVSRFIELRQQTAVRSAPRWSLPVGKVISEQRFDVVTLRPRSR